MTYRILMIGKNSTMPRLTGPTYDATAERWITPPSGVKPDAGGAAALRQSPQEDAHTSASAHSARPAAVPNPNPGRGAPMGVKL